MRKPFAKLHLWISIPFGLLISIICLTGASLVFEQEVTRALNPKLYRIEADGRPSLPPSQLVSRIREQLPDTLHLTTLRLSGDPGESCMASFQESGRQTLSVDPRTGEVLGWTKTPGFFRTMRQLHRWLMDAPASKGSSSVGKQIVGISTLLMVIVLVSGLAIWIPRNRKALKYRLKVSCTNGWRRFWHDFHVSLGFYATLLLLVMALTGLTWSFGWYRKAAYGLFGGAARQEVPVAAANGSSKGSGEAAAARSGQPSGNPEHATSNASTKGASEGESGGDRGEAFDFRVWDTLLRELQRQYPSYKTITLGSANAQIAANTHVRHIDTATFDHSTGRIREITLYRDTPRSQTLRNWFYAFHTGIWGGLTTRILYFLAALIGGTLPLTGYYLWWKRTRSRKQHSKPTR